MKRWKVIIADDEPIIREGIRDAIDWDELGLELVAEAEDGEVALEQALAHCADIMLVDLNMPIMDGMTLMRRLRQQRPACRLIVLTGYDEFEFARESLRLQVDDYILKPANPRQLHDVMEKARDQLQADAERDEYLRLASGQIERNYPLLAERFCLDWIEGNVPETELEDQLKFLNLPACLPRLLGIVRWPDLSRHRSVWSEKDRQLLSFAVENIVQERLADREHVLFRDRTGVLVFLLWNTLDDHWSEQTEETIRQLLKISVRIGTTTVRNRAEIDHSVDPVVDPGTDRYGHGAVPAAYTRCKEQVYGEAQLSPLVRRARQYIREHYADSQLTLERLAEQLHVSPVYLSRVIRQELETTYIQMLTQTRMEKAAQLLIATEMTISEIAELTGYETQHYFSSVFKKTMGITPNQYRRRPWHEFGHD